jgi:hypothetical protein
MFWRVFGKASEFKVERDFCTGNRQNQNYF